MSLRVPIPPGLERMMKQGSQRYTGLEEGIYRNIEACIEMGKYITSTYGPNGRSKMVINYLEKLFVTSDASTIIKELDIQHPACKLIVMAVQHQERECGDGTTAVFLMTIALLEKGMSLLRSGLPLKMLISGYQEAMDFLLNTLPDLVVDSVVDLKNKNELLKAIYSPICSKQCGLESFISGLVSEACTTILPSSGNFTVDNVRVCRILGSSLQSSHVVKGMVFKTSPESSVTEVRGAKVGIFTCAFDILHTETKGTVLIETAQELLNFSKNEEDLIEKQIREIAESGCNVIVSVGKVGDMHRHFANKYGLMIVRLTSKFDIKRLCSVTGATSQPRIVPFNSSNMGTCDLVYFHEIGSTKVVIFRQDVDDSLVSTVVLRGFSDHMMVDVEKAVDDGINAFKMLTRDNRLLPGGGAVELELANRLQKLSKNCPGALEEASMAFLSLVKQIGDNVGVNGTEYVNKVFAEHVKGSQNYGIIVEGDSLSIGDVVESNLYDLYASKYWFVKNSFSAAISILKVDEIIMSKPAGGPRPRETGTNAVRDTGFEED